MIYEALIAPHERPPTLRDVKRALLTYDKVILIDPADRDMMPSNAFMSAIMGIPLFGMDVGPIRPMGKTLTYDDQFSEMLEACQQAKTEGLLELRSTYTKEGSGQFTIGAVLTGGYPLNTQFVFWLYRSMATDQVFLRSAIENDSKLLLTELSSRSALAPEGRGDGGINDIPALPLLDRTGYSEVHVASLTQIARARLGAFIKYAGYCEAKNIVPVLPSTVYGEIAKHLLNSARETLSAADEDQFWSRRNRVLELCHEEFIVDSRLDELSVRDVLRLRTTAWGRLAQAREHLFESVFAIAQEAPEATTFEEQARALIRDYRKSSEDVVREREKLAFELKCDLGSAALGGGVGVLGLMSQLESPLASIGITLAAGGLWAFDKAKKYVPILRELQAKEKEMKRGAGFGLHDFYSRVSRG